MKIYDRIISKILILCFLAITVNINSSFSQIKDWKYFNLKGNVKVIEMNDSSAKTEKGYTEKEVTFRRLEFDSLGFLVKDTNERGWCTVYLYELSFDDAGNQIVNIKTPVLEENYILDQAKNPIENTTSQKGYPPRKIIYKNTYVGNKLYRVDHFEDEINTKFEKYLYSDSTGITTAKFYNSSGKKLYRVERTDKENRLLEGVDYNDDGTIKTKTTCTYTGKVTVKKKFDGKGLLMEITNLTSDFDSQGNSVKIEGSVNILEHNTKVNWFSKRSISYY